MTSFLRVADQAAAAWAMWWFCDRTEAQVRVEEQTGHGSGRRQCRTVTGRQGAIEVVRHGDSPIALEARGRGLGLNGDTQLGRWGPSPGSPRLNRLHLLSRRESWVLVRCSSLAEACCLVLGVAESANGATLD